MPETASVPMFETATVPAFETATVSTPEAPTIAARVTAVMIELEVVKTPADEIVPVFSLEERTVVREVYTIPVVTVPCRIVIVYITGEIGFASRRIGIISAVVFRRRLRIFRIRLGIYRSGLINHGRRCCINSDAGDTYPDTGAYIYLGIAPGGDEARGGDGGEDG